MLSSCYNDLVRAVRTCVRTRGPALENVIQTNEARRTFGISPLGLVLLCTRRHPKIEQLCICTLNCRTECFGPIHCVVCPEVKQTMLMVGLTFPVSSQALWCLQARSGGPRMQYIVAAKRVNTTEFRCLTLHLLIINSRSV